MSAQSDLDDILQVLADDLAAAEARPQALAFALAVLLELTGCERGYAALLNPAGELAFVTGTGLDAATVSRDIFTGSREATAEAAASGVVVVTTSADHDARMSAVGSLAGVVLRSVIAAPLIVGGQTVGALYVDRHVRFGLFPEDINVTVTHFIERLGEELGRFWEG